MVYQLVIGFILCNQPSNIVALLCISKKNLNFFIIKGPQRPLFRPCRFAEILIRSWRFTIKLLYLCDIKR